MVILQNLLSVDVQLTLLSRKVEVGPFAPTILTDQEYQANKAKITALINANTLAIENLNTFATQMPGVRNVDGTNGDDVNGNGSLQFPYQTLDKALSDFDFTDLSTIKTINLTAGIYLTATDIPMSQLALNGAGVGDFFNPFTGVAKNDFSQNIWNPDPSTDTSCVMTNLIFAGAFLVTKAPGSTSHAQLELVNVVTQLDTQFDGTGAGLDSIDTHNTSMDNTILNGCNLHSRGGSQFGLTVNSQGVDASDPDASIFLTEVDHTNINLTGTVNLSANRSGFFGGGVTLNDTGSTYRTDVISMPAQGFSGFTLLGGATISQVALANRSDGIKAPTAPSGTWDTSDPQAVNEVILRLAAAVSGLLGGPIP